MEKEPILDLEETNQAEEKKPVVYRSDRRRSGIREVTHILSPEMLPPVTKRKLAIYQVINTQRKDPLLAGNATGDEILPYDVIIPGTYMIYDPFEKDLMKRDKIMRNVTRPGIEVRDGKQVQVEVVEDIVLYHGLLEVNQESQYPLYCLMELHPLNKSNKRRDTSKAAVFERIDMKFRSVASMDAIEDLKEDASRYVKDLPIDKVIGYCATMNLPTANIQPSELRYSLRMAAKNDPIGFFKLNPTSEQMTRINFHDAVDLGFVEYVPDKKGYRFSNEDKVFFAHAVGEEPVSACVKFLASAKGEATYNRIQEYLGYWE